MLALPLSLPFALLWVEAVQHPHIVPFTPFLPGLPVRLQLQHCRGTEQAQLSLPWQRCSVEMVSSAGGMISIAFTFEITPSVLQFFSMWRVVEVGWTRDEQK